MMRESRTHHRILAFALLALTAIAATGILEERLSEKSTMQNDLAYSDSRQHESGIIEFPVIDWDKWKGINDDVVGWVTVEGTQIDQPIVQAHLSDPTYYLDHDVHGRANGEGCAFLDAECYEDALLSKNSVIFGHHLTKERGFSHFAKYTNEDFAIGHKRILLQTPEWQKALEVLFIEITKGNSPTKVTSFKDDEQFRLWLTSRLNASCIKLADDDIISELPARIWTFCTCSYTAYEDERTLVYAAEACN